ncbi:hypothetical protein EN788_17235 [Mesorhizobium sp. M2D.F.Ca.ET.145.01.1.1]|nr:hypothetical protein EN788_17235 [Mesorhizobium sp. M2D.F.Ca.ET.145.01.1.1]
MTPANINLLHAGSIWHATRWRRVAVFMTYSPHREMAASRRLLFIAIFDKWSGTMPFSRPVRHGMVREQEFKTPSGQGTRQ